jgi:hypothetical protein
METARGRGPVDLRMRSTIDGRCPCCPPVPPGRRPRDAGGSRIPQPTSPDLAPSATPTPRHESCRVRHPPDSSTSRPAAPGTAPEARRRGRGETPPSVRRDVFMRRTDGGRLALPAGEAAAVVDVSHCRTTPGGEHVRDVRAYSVRHDVADATSQTKPAALPSDPNTHILHCMTSFSEISSGAG